MLDEAAHQEERRLDYRPARPYSPAISQHASSSPHTKAPDRACATLQHDGRWLLSFLDPRAASSEDEVHGDTSEGNRAVRPSSHDPVVSHPSANRADAVTSTPRADRFVCGKCCHACSFMCL